MIFKYTSYINVAECDMDEICNDVKNGRDFADAFEDVMSGYDSCDYYHSDDIYESVEKEIERRIKESEKEKTKMPMITKEMTNEELIALRNEINKALIARVNERRDNAMDNFRKAFEEIRELCVEIYVSDYDGYEISIEKFDDFHFDY